MAEISLIKYVRDNCYNDIFKYVQKHYYDDVELCSIYIDKLYTELFYEELDIWAVIDIELISNGKETQERRYINFRMEPKKDFELTKFFEFTDTFPQQEQVYPLADNLVPYISRGDLENVATNFLQRYYPLALVEPIPVKAKDLAESMGLSVIEYPITADKSVFGQITFQDTEVELYNDEENSVEKVWLPKGTICVDPDVYYLRSYGAVQNTIVHECVHWDFHKNTFDLGYLMNQDTTKMVCRVSGDVQRKVIGCDTQFIEWQANALAPRIQMPKDMFILKAKEFISYYRELYRLPQSKTLDILSVVISELADFFKVSKLAAKIRMYEVGFYEVAGVLESVDEEYVRPYKFKKGAINRKETYSIGFRDLLVVTALNSDIQKAFIKGTFVYAEHHICLNEPKYIQRNGCGEYELTEYARYHVDECCISFKLELKNGYKHSTFSDNTVLYRESSVIEIQAHYKKCKSNNDIVEQANQLIAYTKENYELAQNLPASFGKALDYLIKHYKLKYTEVAADALISERTLRYLRDDVRQPSKETVVALCIALHLEPIISQQLLLRAGHNLNVINEDCMILNTILNTMYNKDIYEANNILYSLGREPLTAKE